MFCWSLPQEKDLAHSYFYLICTCILGFEEKQVGGKFWTEIAFLEAVVREARDPGVYRMVAFLRRNHIFLQEYF